MKNLNDMFFKQPYDGTNFRMFIEFDYFIWGLIADFRIEGNKNYRRICVYYSNTV